MRAERSGWEPGRRVRYLARDPDPRPREAPSIAWPTVPTTTPGAPARPSVAGPEERADLSTACLACGSAMRPEHAHYRCPSCGWRDSCCDGPY